MGKLRKTAGGVSKERDDSSKAGKSEDKSGKLLLDPTNKNFIYDEVDDFEDRQDRIFLERGEEMMKRREAPREQILGISGSSSDDGDSTEDDDDASDEDNDKSDPDELYLEDDIVDEPEFKLPDDRAWGKKKHRYFGTDTTEEKIQWNLYNQDEELAQVEEETAKKLQERMAAELKDLVFDDLIPQFDDQNKSEHNQKKDLVEADISLLSKCKKLQLLKTESPEFLPVIEDLKSKCEELRCILSPLMDGIKLGKVPEGPIHHYITTKYRLVLNYVCNISMYMTIKCSSKSVRTHPVVGRLAQYRQLLQELEDCDNKLASHLAKLLNDISKTEEAGKVSASSTEEIKPKKRKKELQIIRKGSVAKLEEKKRLMALLKGSIDNGIRNDTKAIVKEPTPSNLIEASSDEEHDTQKMEEEEMPELGPDEKRPIGYGIAKNKGLIPYRRKDMRNPRVRYKKKFDKKLKRRKGQVREMRKELKRYSGEATGIRSHTVKSIKIKS